MATTGTNPDGSERMPGSINFRGRRLWRAGRLGTVDDATGSHMPTVRGGIDKIGLKLPGQASGAIASSSPAGTEKRGALNPAFSLWLMGYPAAWASCGERAMQSCRKLQQNSSKLT